MVCLSASAAALAGLLILIVPDKLLSTANEVDRIAGYDVASWPLTTRSILANKRRFWGATDMPSAKSLLAMTRLTQRRH